MVGANGSLFGGSNGLFAGTNGSPLVEPNGSPLAAPNGSRVLETNGGCDDEGANGSPDAVVETGANGSPGVEEKGFGRRALEVLKGSLSLKLVCWLLDFGKGMTRVSLNKYEEERQRRAATGCFTA